MVSLRKLLHKIPFVRNRFARNRLRYAAAKVDHLTGGWLPAGTNLNDLINQSNPIIRNRTRQLVRDFPPFAKATNALVRFCTGEGIRFQSRVMDTNGEPDNKTRRAIEDAVKRFMDECDVAGSPAMRMHFSQIEALAKRQEVEGGEFLVIKQDHRDRRNKFLPWGIQMIESDRLTDHQARPLKTSAMSNGVEYDPKTGSMIAFHIGDEGYGKPTRVLADKVKFGFDRQRAGQMRGVTLFAPALLLAHDLADALDAKMDRFKLTSKWLAFVTTPDPAGYQGLRTGQKTTELGGKIEELENATIEYLRPGEEVNFANMPTGSEDEIAFAMFLMRLVSITADGMPYEILTNEYSGLKYTGMRVGRNDFMQQFRPVQRRHVFQLTKPVIEDVIESAVLHGRLSLPGYWSNPWRYRDGIYIPPGLHPVDPLKENKADVEAIKAGLKSPQQCILSRGGDPEQTLDELKVWASMLDERGINLDMFSISTASAGNPAALDNDLGDGDDRKLKVVK